MNGAPSRAAPRRSPWPGVLLAVIALGCLGFGAWYFWLRPHGPQAGPGPPPDMEAAIRANNRGVGWMEWFEKGKVPGETGYDNAVKEFGEAIRLAPDWLPFRINLGIALLNSSAPGNRERAEQLFKDVLGQEPKNPHAHFCLGIIAENAGRTEEAYAHFTAVTEIDPNDPHAWYHRALTHPQAHESAESRRFLEKALALNPYLGGALHALAHHRHGWDPAKTKEIVERLQGLKDSFWDEWTRLAYTEMGKYAEVVGRHPDLVARPPADPIPVFEKAPAEVKLAPGACWAKAADFGQGPAGDLRRAVRQRFGATMVLFDYDGDGRPDVLLLGAVVENGKVRDLLLRNEGNFHFTDVTAEAGLAEPRPSLGCAVADFDNDGRPDLLITGAGEQHLFRNTGGRFEDVSKQAGLDQVRGVCLAAAWLDLDQDGDLDLLLSEVAPSAELAFPFDLGPRAQFNSQVHVLLNVGQAPPVRPGGKPAALTVAFRPAREKEAFRIGGGFKVSGLAVSDLDGDGDVDVLALTEGSGATAQLNDRLLRFHPAPLVNQPGHWNGALVLDVNHDGRSDVLLLRHQAPPTLLLSRGGRAGGELKEGFAEGPTNSPPLLQAHAVDLDLDGWTDVVGLSKDRVPVYLRNDGVGRLVHHPEVIGGNGEWPADLQALQAADLDDDCSPDVLLWSESGGLEVRRSKGNGNRGLKLVVTGMRENADYRRTNADGVGAWVTARAGNTWTGQENATLSAGLGQSRLPLFLGIGKAAQADFVRILWPDTVPQAELNQPTCSIQRIPETYRKGISCPILFTWNGTQFGYVTDLIGAGSMGETAPDGSHRPPRPNESAKIEPEHLAPLNGEYVLRLAEPMDELMYLDRLRLVAVDHPADVAVFPDERFAGEPPFPSQTLLAFRERDRVFPSAARDHQGRDVTAVLRERDGKMVNGFARRSWIGYAEEHWVELEFPTVPRANPGEKLYLVLAGWTDYPYPESIYAATQAGVPLLAPLLEKLGPDGTWQPVCDLSFPAGLPRVMTRDLTGLLTENDTRLRIRTNMAVYWDQIYLARVPDSEAAFGCRARTLGLSSAALAYRGFLREKRVGRDGLVEYDPERTERVEVSRWSGRLTRLGDVTELLREADDRFVIGGPGDEVTVRFDAKSLPPLPQGWKRSFVLQVEGYCKDSSPFTATGGEVGPLPFRAMKNYPPAADEKPPAYQAAYDREWNTRKPQRTASRDRKRPE
jgi:tetratricopeptide (TPR) repeat protein